MTTKEQTQLDRFLANGYAPDVAAQLIQRGAWLETTGMSAQDVGAVQEYRAERDGEAASPPDSAA